jgi:hypothetical protein
VLPIGLLLLGVLSSCTGYLHSDVLQGLRDGEGPKDDQEDLLSPTTYVISESFPLAGAAEYGSAFVGPGGDNIRFVGGRSNGSTPLHVREWSLGFSPLDWSSTMDSVYNFGSALLGSGHFLVVGGYWGGSQQNGIQLVNFQNQSVSKQTLGVPRVLPAVLAHSDQPSRALVCGGNASGTVIRTCYRIAMTPTELNVWPATDMPVGRIRQANAISLPGGRFVFFGAGANPVVHRYTWDTDTWETLSPLQVGRSDAVATRLVDGRVLVSGGVTAGGQYVGTLELYDLSANGGSGSSTIVGELVGVRGEGHQSIVLPDGRVMLIGGERQTSGAHNNLIQRRVEIFDPKSYSVVQVGLLPTSDSQALIGWNVPAVLLANGTIVLAGGSEGRLVQSVERYVVIEPEAQP